MARDTCSANNRNQKLGPFQANRLCQSEGEIWVRVRSKRNIATKAARKTGGSKSLHVTWKFFLAEHSNQGGQENGRLKITSRDMEIYGIHHRFQPKAIDELVAAGFIKVIVPGRRCCGADKGHPPQYAITWLPIIEPENMTKPTNEWRNFNPAAAGFSRARNVVHLTAAAAGRYQSIEGAAYVVRRDVPSEPVAPVVRRERGTRGAQKPAPVVRRGKNFWSHKKQALVVINERPILE
jgi:hypothetical protein